MSVVPYTGSRSRDRAISRFSLDSSDDRGHFSRNSIPRQRLIIPREREIVPRERQRSSARSLISKLLNDSDDIEDDNMDTYGSSRNVFSQMDQMMGAMMRDPFAADPFYRGSPFPALMAPPQNPPRGGGRDMFGFPNMGALMSMGNMTGDGSCHSYSSSSVMTMTTGPDGRPQVYQATASSVGAPGGVRETKRTVSDSSSGVRQMAIGHHINDRSHLIEKEMDRNGAIEERQEFVNLDEEEAESFDREFRHRIQPSGVRAIDRQRFRSERPTTGSPTRQRYLPALPSSSSRLDERPKHREKGAGRPRKSQQ